MSEVVEESAGRRWRFAAPSLLFLVTLILYHGSPVRPLSDAQYTLLVSETLLTTGSFALDRHFVDEAFGTRAHKGKKAKAKRIERRRRRELHKRWLEGEMPYQVEFSRGHLYYFFPPGSSLLSLPLVAGLRPFGFSSLSDDGSYDAKGERRLQKRIASLLMALFAVLVYLQARLLLPPGWSQVIALGAALGTQVWSTASRVLWSHTWALVLLAVVSWLLLADETGRRRFGSVSFGALLATLLAWAYFTRPTAALASVLVIAWLAIRSHRSLVSFASVLIGWIALGMTYSWVHFGRLLPRYFAPRRLGSADFLQGLAGNLISPSRGLLIFVPQLLFVVYLLLRYRERLRHRLLVGLCLSLCGLHWLVISSYPRWWGGHSYGPRLMTDTLPWLVLLTICAIEAWLRPGLPRSRSPGFRREAVVGALLLALGIFLHGAGANSRKTGWWNSVPQDVDDHPERIWDWRDPQFLAWRTPREEPDYDETDGQDEGRLPPVIPEPEPPPTGR